MIRLAPAQEFAVPKQFYGPLETQPVFRPVGPGLTQPIPIASPEGLPPRQPTIGSEFIDPLFERIFPEEPSPAPLPFPDAPPSGTVDDLKRLSGEDCPLFVVKGGIATPKRLID